MVNPEILLQRQIRMRKLDDLKQPRQQQRVNRRIGQVRMCPTELGGLRAYDRSGRRVGGDRLSGNRLFVQPLFIEQVNAEGPDTIRGEPASLGDVESQLSIVHSFPG